MDQDGSSSIAAGRLPQGSFIPLSGPVNPWLMAAPEPQKPRNPYYSQGRLQDDDESHRCPYKFHGRGHKPS